VRLVRAWLAAGTPTGRQLSGPQPVEEEEEEEGRLWRTGATLAAGEQLFGLEEGQFGPRQSAGEHAAQQQRQRCVHCARAPNLYGRAPPGGASGALTSLAVVLAGDSERPAGVA